MPGPFLADARHRLPVHPQRQANYAGIAQLAWSHEGSRATLSCIVLGRCVMTGPGDQIAAGAGGRGRLRASHADREHVVGTLKSAFVQGMLAKDEFDLRVGEALVSRTYAELAAPTADLPAGLAPALPP